MPRLKSNENPVYRFFKPRNCASVRISGHTYYLGPWESQESLVLYNRLVAAWIGHGRELSPEEGKAAMTGKPPVTVGAAPGQVEQAGDDSAPAGITVGELVAQYLTYAKGYYTKSEYGAILSAVRPLLKLYGRIEAVRMGPVALKTAREAMVALGWARSTVNAAIKRVQRVFKWAVSEELLPASVHQALATVGGLRAGRTAAPDRPKVKPVPAAWIDQTLPHCSRTTAAMIQLQLLSGCRSGELVLLRPRDLDVSAKAWVFTPAKHKTEHRGYDRRIFLGPKAQAILEPFLARPTDCYCFSPKEAERERLDARHAARVTPLKWGNRRGKNRRRRPRRHPGDRFTTESYRRSVLYACCKAWPLPAPLARRAGETRAEYANRLTDEDRTAVRAWRREHSWHPHQLRHNAASTLRREYGLDAAKVILGHTTVMATQIYAEQDLAKAAAIMAAVG